MNRSLTTVALIAAALALSACAGPATPAGVTPTPPDAGHGAVRGATEVSEPQLRLVTIDADGATGTLDLLTGEARTIGEVGAPRAIDTDGRYVFASTAAGIEVVDSGAWTWDHVDHFHYYRADPALLGAVAGEGPATVAAGALSTAGATGLFFAGSGEAVLLDNGALSRGELVERLRVAVPPHAGIVAPLGDGALLTEAGSGGAATALQFRDADGEPVAGARTECEQASGVITTRVALAIGCADGAVLATMDAGAPVFQRVPYPVDGAAPATAFSARKGRPTVAGLGADPGVWLLDTREAAWQWLPTARPLLRATAVDDEEGHVVALDAEGRVVVLRAGTGDELAATEPLLPETLADERLADAVSLTVDGQRAYLSAAAEGVVYEIDYADGARVARTLETPTAPLHVAETGR